MKNEEEMNELRVRINNCTHEELWKGFTDAVGINAAEKFRPFICKEAKAEKIKDIKKETLYDIFKACLLRSAFDEDYDD